YVYYVYRRVSLAQMRDGQLQQLFDMPLALADTAPADGIQIVSVDQPTQHCFAGRLVAVDVIQSASRIEAGIESQSDTRRQPGGQPHARPCGEPVQRR